MQPREYNKALYRYANEEEMASSYMLHSQQVGRSKKKKLNAVGQSGQLNVRLWCTHGHYKSKVQKYDKKI